MTIANLARSRIVRLAALLTAALALVGCDTYPVNYKYRLTLEVEADGKVHTGSSVVHVWVRENAEFWGGMGGAHRGALGEATIVELGDGRLLVALLTDRENIRKVWMPDNRKPPASRDLDPWELPLLVTFTDASNPKTVREVDPNESGVDTRPRRSAAACPRRGRRGAANTQNSGATTMAPDDRARDARWKKIFDDRC